MLFKLYTDKLSFLKNIVIPISHSGLTYKIDTETPYFNFGLRSKRETTQKYGTIPLSHSFVWKNLKMVISSPSQQSRTAAHLSVEQLRQGHSSEKRLCQIFPSTRRRMRSVSCGFAVLLYAAFFLGYGSAQTTAPNGTPAKASFGKCIPG